MAWNVKLDAKVWKDINKEHIVDIAHFDLNQLRNHPMSLPLVPHTKVVNVFFHTVHLPVNGMDGNVKVHFSPPCEKMCSFPLSNHHSLKNGKPLRPINTQKVGICNANCRILTKKIPPWLTLNKKASNYFANTEIYVQEITWTESRDITMGFLSTLSIKA